LAQKMIDVYGMDYGKIEVQVKNKAVYLITLSEGLYKNKGQVNPQGSKD